YDRGKRPCVGRRDSQVAAADSEFEAARVAWKFVSRRGDRRGSVRQGGAGIHSAEQPRHARIRMSCLSFDMRAPGSKLRLFHFRARGLDDFPPALEIFAYLLLKLVRPAGRD